MEQRGDVRGRGNQRNVVSNGRPLAIEIPMDDTLQELQRWYAKHCDGEWEHQYGIKITTCDNPGWWMKIDLMGTDLNTRLYKPIADNVDASGFPQGDRWMHCFIKDDVWEGAGDETKLLIIIKMFLAWAATQ
ncbi:MAG: immunity 53 family protein [Isosphaeraceae bacterium]